MHSDRRVKKVLMMVAIKNEIKHLSNKKGAALNERLLFYVYTVAAKD